MLLGRLGVHRERRAGHADVLVRRAWLLSVAHRRAMLGLWRWLLVLSVFGRRHGEEVFPHGGHGRWLLPWPGGGVGGTRGVSDVIL